MSKHTLISFLGKSKLNQQTGYRKANYDFGNGILKEVSFFGIGLTEVLKPHKLILIGTAGSMWDVFFDHHTPENEQVLNLVDAVAESRVDESLLTSCEEEIGRMLGCEVKCLIIDYAGNEAEQIHLLSPNCRTARGRRRNQHGCYPFIPASAHAGIGGRSLSQ